MPPRDINLLVNEQPRFTPLLWALVNHHREIVQQLLGGEFPQPTLLTDKELAAKNGG